MRTFSLLSLLLVALLPFLTLTMAQSMHQSATPVRRAHGPFPTSIDQVTDPALLELLAVRNAPIDLGSDKSGSGGVSRSRARKIKGFGHEADQLPLTNAERIRLGLPLKPPAVKKAKAPTHPQGEDEEFEMEDGEWNWLEGGRPF